MEHEDFITQTPEGRLALRLTTEAKDILLEVNKNTGIPLPKIFQEEPSGLWLVSMNYLVLENLARMARPEDKSPSDTILRVAKYQIEKFGKLRTPPYQIAQFIRKGEDGYPEMFLTAAAQTALLASLNETRGPLAHLLPQLSGISEDPVDGWVPVDNETIHRLYAGSEEPDKSLSDTIVRLRAKMNAAREA